MDEDLRRQVLYEIKIPRPKAPDMATLNAKLKLARIHKMAKCKEMLLQSRYSRLSWSNEPESGLPDAPTDKPLPENTATRTLSHPIFRKPQLRSYCKFARLIRE